MFKKINSPIFVALDLDSDKEALKLAQQVEPFVGGFKVGPRLCLRYGAPLIKSLAELGHVFVDNKYFDIPNTMEHALRASFEAGATFATIHAQAGAEAMQRMAKLESELNQERSFRILAVTVLTSFYQEGLPPNTCEMSIEDQVTQLAKLSIDSGITGLVCSPNEASRVKAMCPGAFIVTPGIRLPTDDKGDQRRVMGPKEAMAMGATALVVGRPIVDAPDPKAAAKRFFDEVDPKD